ncbi:hypothetical protein [Palaeococcus sp. (in: euryarchaeotes)]
MEYAGKYGVNGIYSIIMVTLGFWIATTLSFELARVFKAFDYKTWIKQLLWKFWPAFDITYIPLAVIIIAVVGSAAANILEDMFNIPYMIGAITIILAVGILHFYGRRAIESFETIGTVMLYIILAPGMPIQAMISGIQYFAYNLGVIPAVLFVLYRLVRREKRLNHSWNLCFGPCYAGIHTNMAL